MSIMRPRSAKNLRETPKMSQPAQRQINLVVVDDDPSIVRFITQLIKNEKGDAVNLVSFDDPRKAVAWIDENWCDIILSDICMPHVDGLELMRRAKRSCAWTQVIFMTAHSSSDRIAEAIELGASDYLLKPIDAKDLLDLIEHVCSRVARWQVALSGTFSTHRTATNG